MSSKDRTMHNPFTLGFAISKDSRVRLNTSCSEDDKGEKVSFKNLQKTQLPIGVAEVR
ncbi:hypothetical protein TUM4261_03700 [Shewanella sp. c952]|nr:hypothetical protein TUM4261_03700 [Shewanella sp. c952]